MFALSRSRPSLAVRTLAASHVSPSDRKINFISARGFIAMQPRDSVTVAVPATSANMGPVLEGGRRYGIWWGVTTSFL
eukprot:1388324-Amorphochlora_amoeboformis.AAC.2